jgi:hypothetical protein
MNAPNNLPTGTDRDRAVWSWQITPGSIHDEKLTEVVAGLCEGADQTDNLLTLHVEFWKDGEVFPHPGEFVWLVDQQRGFLVMNDEDVYTTIAVDQGDAIRRILQLDGLHPTETMNGYFP